MLKRIGLLTAVGVLCVSWAGAAQAQCIVDTSTPTYANGEFLRYHPCDANGNVKVTGGGGGGGAATIADGADVNQGATTDAAATAGGTGTVSAKLRNATALLNSIRTAVEAGGTAANQATLHGYVDGLEALLTTIDADTGTIATNSTTLAGAVKAEDAAHTTGDTGIMSLCVRTDTAAARATTDGDYIPCTTDVDGRIHTTNPAISGTKMRAMLVDSSGNEVVMPTAGLTHYDAADASTNSTAVLAAAGTVYHYSLSNTTTTVYYLRMYNSASAPTCSSATGFVESIPIPPASAAGQVGGRERIMNIGQAFTTGIAYCITASSGSTANDAAAAGVFVTLLYKAN